MIRRKIEPADRRMGQTRSEAGFGAPPWDHAWATSDCSASRRMFMRFILSSPFAAGLGSLQISSAQAQDAADLSQRPGLVRNVFQMEDRAREKLDPDTYYFVADGSDDMKTVQANRDAFDQVQIRARRLIDVSEIDTSLSLFGQTMETPILLAPAGAQQRLHPQGELDTARAAAAKNHTMIVSTMSSYGIGDIAASSAANVWFQLYPTPDRAIMRALLDKAADAGAAVTALTVDSAAFGNRERQPSRAGSATSSRAPVMMPGNFDGLPGGPRIGDSSMTWEIVDWLRANTQSKILLKGIVTWEDARLCVERGVDGIIVSNHGGRQEESLRGTLECLPEIVEEVNGRMPVLIDGGFRRGTDIFKALAMGASAICIGRPYLWGLAAFGQDGVERVLTILRAELVRIMKLAGTPSLADIAPDRIRHTG